MNKNLIPLVGIILATLVSGCAKNNDNKNNDQTVNQQKQQPKAVDLSGKSLEEVLALKYNKAELKCELWTQLSNQLDISGTPNDSASWDLKSGVAMPEVLNLKGEIQNHKISIEVKLNSVSLLSSLNHLDSDLTRFELRYSPTVNVNITHESITTFPTGPFIASGYGSSRNINEKIKDIPVNGSLATEPEQQNGITIDRGSYRDYAHCFIDTEIKSEYQDQFKVQPRNP